jgi:predicted ABC-type ATPase
MTPFQEDDWHLTLVTAPRGMTDEEVQHYLRTGEAPPLDSAPNSALTAAAFKFNPGQPRDSDGRWTRTGTDVGRAVADVARRTALIERAIHSPQAQTTEQTHTIAPGVWSPERDRIHREIVNDIYAKAAHVPNNGHAIMLGGPPGAGKTSTLHDSVGVNPSDYLVINPDDMKEELARRGLIPEIPGHDLSPMERSSLVHAESMRLARMLADRAYHDHKNIIWDTTMSWRSATESHIKALRDAKYHKIDAVVIDVSENVRRKRALERYAAGQRAYENGHGYGGRYVPEKVMHDQHDAEGHSYARGVLRGLSHQFDNWFIYDNSRDGQPPQRLAGKGEIK